MEIKPRFRVGPLQVTGGQGCLLVILAVMLLCIFGGCITGVLAR